MLHLVLFRPEIPPNTGNIMRLCANTNTALHLIGPLGFDLEDARLRRAGLDYREWAEVEQYDDLEAALASAEPSSVYAFTRDGEHLYSSLSYQEGDLLLFGPESEGLPEDVVSHSAITATARIPMLARSRSLNLSNAAAVALYEALRQLGYPGLAVKSGVSRDAKTARRAD